MSGLYTPFISGWLFPLHERLKRHSTLRVRRNLDDTQWWPADKLEALRVERLRALLEQAAHHVPYYRDLFHQQGFDPAKVRSTADLQQLPFLTKAIIRRHTEGLKHEGARGLRRFNTGGSSGEPLVFFIGSERVSHDVAAKWRATRWWGVDIGDPEIVVWGSPIELGSQDKIRGLRDKVLRTELLPAFEMSSAKLDDFVDAIRRRWPRMLFGYPSALSYIAAHAENRGQPMDDLGIQVAFVTSERLYDEQRAIIGRVFGCPVANGYGGRDAGFVAHECPQGGMHLTAEDIVLEIVDRGGRVLPPGEPGEIAITHLATRDFPFIRYRTGDVAALSPERCVCGRGLPMIKEIQGRTTDFVFAADGTAMHGLALIYILRDLPEVQQFKIIQESLLETRILLRTEIAFGAAFAADIVRKVRARLGENVNVSVERLAEIPPEPSGKYRYVVSRVENIRLDDKSHA